MDAALVGILGIIVLLIVLFILGMPVGFAMAVVGFCGFSYVITPQAALNMIATDLWSTFSKYGLTVIPLFILMGYLAFHAGIAERLYDAAYKWVGHWRGGLAIATIAADEMFAAICGSNTATAATMGAVALPQMNKYNYDTRLSTGTVVTGGTLGTVMPPSVVLIIIGLQTEQSIVKLFLAGILPAIVLGLLFVVTIIVLLDIPPLRDRMEDIPELVDYFINKYCASMNKAPIQIDPPALQRLDYFTYPGNIRELENMIERAIVIGNGKKIYLKDLPLEEHLKNDSFESLDDLEKNHILFILNKYSWNISRSARALKIDRVTLYNKIKKYELKPSK